jgi:hypothetical protein
MRVKGGSSIAWAREIKDFCDCMKSKKSEAKEMFKLGRCAGCDDLNNAFMQWLSDDSLPQ